jgi:hypothetical protein
MRDVETDERPSVEIQIHIKADDSRSIAEAKREARANALHVLQGTIQLLEAEG